MGNHKWILFLLLLGACPLLAQVDRVDEESVKIQELFIDASKEKLLGNYDNAISVLEEILDKDKRNAAASYELARVHEANGDTQKAVKFAEQAAEWDTGNIWYQKFLANLYQSQGKDADASEVYERIIKIEPDNDEHYFRLAFFLVRANEVKEALKVYDRLEKKVGISEEVIRRKHALYLGIGEDEKAADELRRLINAYPSDLEYRHLLAEFYLQIQQPENARSIYQEILKINPDNAKAQLALAGEGNANRNEIGYLKSLTSAFLQEDADIDIKLKKLIPFIKQVADGGDRQLADAALELTDILEEIHPAEAKAYSAAGDLLFHSGRKKQAIDKYLKTIELDDTRFSVWEQAMRAYMETYQFEALKDFSERAMDYYPNQPLVYYHYAYALYELDEPEDALAELDQAFLMAGGNAYVEILVRSLQGLLYNKTGQADRSDNVFEKALQMDPAAPPALSRYALVLAERGERLKDARNMAMKANELLPKQAEYEGNLAWVHYQMGNYELAAEWMQKALDHGGEYSPELLERYGDTLFQLNKREKAIEYWKAAQRLGEDSEQLQQKISEGKLNYPALREHDPLPFFPGPRRPDQQLWQHGTHY